MSEITRTLEMIFSTELNKNHTIRVYSARSDVTSAETAIVMDDIVARNIFSGPGGEITGKVDARLVTREVEKLNVS